MSDSSNGCCLVAGCVDGVQDKRTILVSGSSALPRATVTGTCPTQYQPAVGCATGLEAVGKHAREWHVTELWWLRILWGILRARLGFWRMVTREACKSSIEQSAETIRTLRG